VTEPPEVRTQASGNLLSTELDSESTFSQASATSAHVINAANAAVWEAAVEGLRARQKTLVPWLFYDEAGSRLFEQITDLPEYYLTRTERALFAEHADEMLAAAAAAPETALHGTMPQTQSRRLTMLELGSGSSSKTGLLLAAAVARQGDVLYQPIDVSASALAEARQTLAKNFPGVRIQPLTANYTTESFVLHRGADEVALALYIGSSIGNFSAAEARGVLANLREHLYAGDALLLGVDLAPGAGKTAAELVAAYDDAEGVTAAFNINVLTRLNRELRADFDLSGFAHRARWNATHSRMEMHLESLRPQTVTLWRDALHGEQVEFAAGETIHTENSHKFSLNSTALPRSKSSEFSLGNPVANSVEMLLNDGGFTLEKVWTDSRRRFAVVLGRAA
jgi:L-histidine N-alpha-methyltransferase